MSATPTDGTSVYRPEQLDDRYGQLPLDDGHTIIYDRENHAAWVQSSTVVSLEAYQ